MDFFSSGIISAAPGFNDDIARDGRSLKRQQDDITQVRAAVGQVNR